MLEKIGLPAKPSMRGANWVVDASHCQGCSSQFTFINRKHHCRRCGGLFCNTCTQQRMILRGQGDSAVRICDPCKKLEDAARFQLRHGYKTRTAKASLKLAPKQEDEIVKQLLEADGAYPSSSAGDSQLNPVSSLKRDASSTSCSNLQEESKCFEDVADTIRSISTVQNELGPSRPEEMRKQAVEEKQRYKVLKGEGKSGEALQAYKRGKELERQATALEITIRKNRRLASVQKTNEDEAVADSKRISSQKIKAQKDDLASELRELGWSDADLHDTDKKTESLSAESELSKLLREIPRTSPVDRALSGIDKTQVLAHKKKAVTLKKDGKMAEAKEELKRAKILEKQLEEQELLAEAEDSDDELSTLIRSINDGKEDEHSFDTHDPGLNFGQFNGLGDDIAVGCNFDVTDDDMNDPDMAYTLKSFGWCEDVEPKPDRHSLQFVPVDNEKLKGEVLSLKKEAVNQKKAGNMAEALGLLRKAKLLETDLQNSQAEEQKSELVSSLNISKSLAEKCPMATEADSKLPRKNKLVIQKELLSLKKKALALRREGRAEEAEEELRKGNDLERQLEEMDNVPKLVETNIGKKSILKPAHAYQDPSLALDLVEEADVAEVTDQDMTDPSLLSVLENLGWKEDVKSTSGGNVSELTHNQAKFVSDPILVPKRRARNKAEIQSELLSVKRKALALRRQGKSEEAEEELIKAKDLKNELTETEVTHSYEDAEKFSGGSGSLVPEKKHENLIKTSGDGDRQDAIKPDYPHQDPSLMLNLLKEADEAEVTEQDMKDPALLSVLESLGWKEGVEFSNTQKSSKLLHDQPSYDCNISSLLAKQARGKAEIQRELLGLKRKALALRQQGKSEEAEEVLTKAKDVENQLADAEVTHPSEYTVASSGGYSNLVPVKMPETLTVTVAGKGKKEVKPIGITESAIKSMDDLKSNDPALSRQGKVGESEELKKTKDLKNLLPDLGVVQPSSIAETSDGFTTLLPGSQQEDTGVILNSDDDMLSLLMGTAPKNGNVIVEYSGPNLKKENYPSDLVRSSVSVPEVSRFESLVPQQTKNVELLPMSSPHANVMDSVTSDEQQVRSMEEQKPVEIMITLPKVSLPANLTDFLTGDEQKVLPIPHIKREEKPAGSTIQLDAVLSSEQDTISCNKTPDQTSNLLGVEKTVHGGPQINQVSVIEANLAHEFVSLKEQVLARKRKALVLKREGKLAEAREELRQAKLLEKRLEGESQQGSINRESQQADINSRNTCTSVYHPAKQESVHESFLQPQKPVKQKCVPGGTFQPQKPASGHDRFKLQQESLSHKRRALKLRREGKMEESEAEFKLAKELESQIEELDSHAPNACKSVVKADEDAVEGFLDPQLMSALKAIGWQEGDIGMLASSKSEAKPQVKQEAMKDTGKNMSISSSKDHLVEQIRAEKLRALNLKHAGKQAEALDALRSAKQLEKQLSLAS